MNKKFTKLLAALALLVFMTPSLAGWGQTRETLSLTFPLASNPGGWPTTNSTTLTNYTYSLEGVNYTFALKNVKCNSGYLMMTSTAVLGLPAIDGYKLTTVVASNSSGCSTSTKVGISNSATQANYISGGAIQTWSTTSSSYTYNLTSTEANTMYYMYVTNKNAQVVELALTYESTGGTPSPSMSVSTNSIDFGSNVINPTNPYTETFDVTFANLTENLTVTGFTGVSVSPTTINYNATSPQTVTVSYNPTAAGSISGNISVNSSEVTEALVAVTGSAYDPSNIQYYEKVTEASSNWSGEYIFTGINSSNYYAFTGISYNVGTAELVTVTENGIQSTPTIEGYKVTVAQTTNGYSLYLAGAGYLYYSGSSNLIYAAQTFTESTCEWTFSFANGVATIANVANGARMFQFNYNNGSPRFVCYTSNQVKLTLFKYNNPNKVKTPTFSPEGGVCTAAQSVTISSETSGASIYYTTDGTVPTTASTLFTEPFTVSTTTTVKAIAVKNGMTDSDVAIATYTFVTPFTTMRQVYEDAVANTSEHEVYITFNDWVITGTNGSSESQFYLTDPDNTYGCVIYGSGSGFTRGNTLNGTVKCKLLYFSSGSSYSFAEIKELTTQTDGLTLGTGGSVTPITTTIDALTSEKTGTVVKLENLTYNGTVLTDNNNNIINNCNYIYSATLTTNKMYDITGVFTYAFAQNNTPKRICPRSADDIEEVVAQSYELEIMATNGSVIVSIGDEVQTGTEGLYQIPQGSVVTLTATPNNGYHFVEWQVEAEEGTVSITNNQFTMPACYVLVQAVFEEVPTVVYYYSINGIDDEEYTEVPEGTIIQLASSQDINSDFTFAGWTTDANDVSNILPAGSNFTMDNTYEFYAVYAHTTGVASNAKDGEASYVKVTSTDELEEGDYLIVSENDFENTATVFNGLSGTEQFVSANISNNTISGTPEDAAVVTIALVEGGYSIKISSDAPNNAGKYIGGTSGSNTMNFNATTPYVNTISFSDGDADIVSNTSHLRWNPSSSNGHLFRYYKSSSYSNMDAVQLYKYTGGSTPTPTPTTTAYYTRVFYNETVEEDIEIIGPSIIPSGQILDMGEDGAIYNSIEAAFIIEDGAELFSNFEVEAATLQKMVLSYDNDEGDGGWKVIASPLTETVAATDVNNLIDANSANYGLFYYDEPNHMWYNYKQNQSGTNLHPGFSIEPGKGYLYAKNSDVMIEFVGEMSAAEDPYVISDLSHASTGANSKGFNLVGNPFTYTVYANQPFYIPSDDILATVDQYWTVGIAPGSGIMVQATEDNNYSVTFTRTAPDEPTKGSVQMTLSQSTTNRGGVTKLDNAIVSFNEGSQLGKFYLGESAANIYIPQGTEEYAIVSAEAQGETPVNFRANENGTYTLSIDTENVEMNYLHLIDNMTGMDIDLLQTPSYTFEATTRDYESRFRLVFAGASTGSATDDNFAFFSNGNLIINNEGNATLQVIDLNGRILSSESVNGSVSTTLNATPGVYMLRLINGDNVKVQKIVVR